MSRRSSDNNLLRGGLVFSAITIIITLGVNYGVMKFNEGVSNTKVKAITQEINTVKALHAKTKEVLHLQVVLNTSQEVRLNHLTKNTEQVIKGLGELSENINNLNTSFAVFNAQKQGK